jgi:hypothetical protein
MNHLQQVEQNQIRGAFLSIYGGFAQQNPLALVSINRLLNAHNFDTIVELGTHTGGLSLLFALYCLNSRTPATCVNSREPSLCVNQTHHKRPKQFHTFDYVIRDEARLDLLAKMGASFYQRDTLTDQTTIDAIRALLSNPASGTVLLLCDGGNKKLEVELYGGSLKPGDFIMAHDWAYDEAAFERNKREGIWMSWETRWENGTKPEEQFGLKDACEANGIEPIYADEFDKVAWFCGRKT